jgi:hypothetical protein
MQLDIARTADRAIIAANYDLVLYSWPPLAAKLPISAKNLS